MSDTFTREDRRSALDEFAAAPMTTGAVVPVAAAAAALPAIIGAQDVKVRRDDRLVLSRIRILAASASDTWYYRYPVRDRKKDSIEWIEGPSVQCTDDVSRIYGNCEVDCRYTDLGNYFQFYARFMDLETGFALTRPFQQRKSAARIGGADDSRREEMALAIGASKATRNVVAHALRTFVDFAFEEARAALTDKIGKDLDKWRTRTVDRITKYAPLNRVEAVIGRVQAEWLAPDVARVLAMGKAIADGMASAIETFPELPGEQAEKKPSALDEFTTSAGAQFPAPGDASSEPPAEADAADAGTEPPSQVPAADKVGKPVEGKADAIRRMFVLAADDTTLADKQQNLTALAAPNGGYDHLPPDFVKILFETIGKVIRGEVKPQAARKYLESL